MSLRHPVGCGAHASIYNRCVDTLHLQHPATHFHTLQRTATQEAEHMPLFTIDVLTHYLQQAYHSGTTHCNALQRTATHCNTLQHTATQYNTLQHTATRCNTHCKTLQHTATYCTTIDVLTHHVQQTYHAGSDAVCCSVLQCVAVCCSVLQCVAVCCSVLQCVAVYSSTIHVLKHYIKHAYHAGS